MRIDLQKAGLWKRVAAWLLDAILLCVLAVGVGYLLSVILGYDAYNDTLQQSYSHYENEYGIVFEQAYGELDEQQKQAYDAAYQALLADAQAMHAYNMVLNLSLLVTTMGILAAMLVLEFLVPLLLGNGQTVGKKVFSLGVIRKDGVRLNTMQLFTRTLLGKFTIETMIPVYLILMMFWGIMDITGTVVLCMLGLVQLISYAVTQTNGVIHDLLAGTAVVDISSQQVFDSTEALIEYTKRIHAERAAKQDY